MDWFHVLYFNCVDNVILFIKDEEKLVISRRNTSMQQFIIIIVYCHLSILTCKYDFVVMHCLNSMSQQVLIVVTVLAHYRIIVLFK